MPSAIINGGSPKKSALVETEFGQIKGKHQWHDPEGVEDGDSGKERSVSS